MVQSLSVGAESLKEALTEQQVPFEPEPVSVHFDLLPHLKEGDSCFIDSRLGHRNGFGLTLTPQASTGRPTRLWKRLGGLVY